MEFQTLGRNQPRIPQLFCRTQHYSNTFFPYSIKEWSNLDSSIVECNSLSIFRKSLLKIIRPTANSVFDICDSNGVKLLTRLRLGLSHLREHKFSHNFRNTINPLCPCNLEVESVSHYFLRCQNFTQQRMILMNELSNIIPSILQKD